MEPSGFSILYEQGPCLVVLKPGGLLTQAPPGIDSLESRVKGYLCRRDQKTGNIYLAVIHRLDRPVSGALLLARHVRAARRLAEQFQRRMVRKSYWAWLEGRVVDERGTWQDYLRKVPGEARAEVVTPETADARQAILHYRVLERRVDATLVEVDLETGRMHQVRVQCAARGHPVLGDALYGAQRPFGPATEDLRERWIALHGRSLEFRHPMTREPVHVQAPLPPTWKELMAE